MPTRLMSSPWPYRLMIGLVLVALLLGMFLPIYTDEIGWRFQERAWIDGVDKMYADTCGPNSLARPPFFMWPVRFYSAYFNTMFPSPLWVRISGVAYALVIVGLLVRLIARLDLPAVTRRTLTIVALGTLALGVEPLLLVWSRPEQPVLICVLTALILASGGAGDGGQTARSTGWWRALGIVVAATIACSYHVKGVFLLPVMVAAVWCGLRGPALASARWLASAVMTIMALWSLAYWANRFACPNDPLLARAYAEHNLGLGYLKYFSVAHTINVAWQNLKLNRDVYRAGPFVEPMADWLQANQLSQRAMTIWRALLVSVWSLVGIPAVVVMVVALWRAWRDRTLAVFTWGHRAFDWQLVMALILFGTVMTWCFTQVLRNVYESAFILPMLIFAFVLAYASAARRGQWQVYARWLASALVVLVPLSMVAIGLTYGPSLARAAAESGFIDEQPRSVGVFNFDATLVELEAAARLCGIGQHGRPANVMIDEVSYFPLMKSATPQMGLGVIGYWARSISDPGAYLRSRGSDGVVVECRSLTGKLRQSARQVGEACCVDRDKL